MKPLHKIALLGATGKAGSCLLKHLLTRQIPCRVLVRNPESSLPAHPLLEIIYGNALDEEAVNRLLEGCSAVVSALGTRKGEPPVQLAATRHIIRGMVTHGITRFVGVTGTTLNVPGDRKPFRSRCIDMLLRGIFGPVLRDKQEAFELLRASRLNWTLVRIPFLKTGEESAPVKCSSDHSPGPSIHANDLANFILQQLNDPHFYGSAPFIAN